MPELEAIKRASTQTTILDVMSKRWSPRAFSDRHVSNDVLFVYGRRNRNFSSYQIQ